MPSKGFKFPVVNIHSKPTEQRLIMSRIIQGNTDVLRIKPNEAVSWYATAQSEKSHTIKLVDEDGNVYIDTEIQSIDLSNSKNDSFISPPNSNGKVQKYTLIFGNCISYITDSANLDDDEATTLVSTFQYACEDSATDPSDPNYDYNDLFFSITFYTRKG